MIVNTQYGKRVVVHINNDDTINAAFLPARYMKPFEDDKKLLLKFIKTIDEEKLYMEYNGDNTNAITFVVKQ